MVFLPHNDLKQFLFLHSTTFLFLTFWNGIWVFRFTARLFSGKQISGKSKKVCHLFEYLCFHGKGLHSNLFNCPSDIMQCTFSLQSVLLAGARPPNGLSCVIMMCNLFWVAPWMPSVIYFNRDDLIGLIDALPRLKVIHRSSVSYWCAQWTGHLWEEMKKVVFSVLWLLKFFSLFFSPSHFN